MNAKRARYLAIRLNGVIHQKGALTLTKENGPLSAQDIMIADRAWKEHRALLRLQPIAPPTHILRRKKR